jgi:hypothetical protein
LIGSLINYRQKGGASGEDITVFIVMSNIELGVEDIQDVDKGICSNLEIVLIQCGPFIVTLVQIMNFLILGVGCPKFGFLKWFEELMKHYTEIGYHDLDIGPSGHEPWVIQSGGISIDLGGILTHQFLGKNLFAIEEAGF